jgi:PHS family inorganic phosphate transporter-like MFS transporter
MGYAGDVFGRNPAMTFTLGLASISALLSALTPSGDATSVYVAIIVCRFLLGVGVGGVYPLSATKAAEDASANPNLKPNSNAASLAFFWQSPGAMLPWSTALILAQTALTNNYKWRLILGLGFVPGALVVIGSLYERKLKSNFPTRAQVDDKQGEGTRTGVLTYLSTSRGITNLIATGGGWFLYDICFCKIFMASLLLYLC